MRLLFPIVVVGFWLSVMTNAVASAQDLPLKLDDKEALKLAALAQPRANERNLEHVMDTLDYNPNANDPGEPPFFVFEGLTDTSSYGFFAVNPWTGDVWALWGCHKMTTHRLRAAQAEIRHHFTAVEMKQYRKLRNIKPFCISGD
jgi:hypothetical protein